MSKKKLMFFQLLQGVHLEDGNVYKVEIERDVKTGEVIKSDRPTIACDRDLVAAFGPEKFRKLDKDETDLLLKQAGITAVEMDTTNLISTAAAEIEMEKAVKQGAVGIAEPPGNDVTSKFPELADWPTVNVYFKRGKGFFVTENNDILTEEPLKRDEVVTWVQKYKEE